MNNQIALIIIAIVCAYVIGSVPSAYIIGRLRKGVNIRQIGSRSMGGSWRHVFLRRNLKDRL